MDAATAIGVTAGRVLKSLVASVDERFVLAVVPVDAPQDLVRLCSAHSAAIARDQGPG
jgi:prolyl-tRNA editing enzyme YbaK/EbsC (Cys-tRNA(Pro) deacylase)